jgi:hypothetical protein
MWRARLIPITLLLVSLSTAAMVFLDRRPENALAQTKQDSTKAYLGFDRNLYPGDDALPILRATFAFAGYWLSPPPREKVNTWSGKRALLRSQGFGFAALYRARTSSEIKGEVIAKQMGALDARNAAAAAKAEGFPAGIVIFLDIEEGGRLAPAYHTYLHTWADELAKEGYRAGVYCSGVLISESGGTTITTAEDIRNNADGREIVYWIFNDVCQPSPGCAATKDAPAVPNGGAPYATIWQFAQSPQRKERTARCATTYATDGNCYAPGDAAHKWHLDLNSATSPDPSGGTR